MTHPNILLHKAKKARNDEFYTRRDTIEAELPHYKEQFKGKRVFCNCDGPESEFVKFFTSDNYKNLHEYDLARFYRRNSDFRGEDSVNGLANYTDIVLTNPPFTLFKEFIDLITQHDKQFLILGPVSAITYGNVFKLFRDNKIRLGYGGYINKFKNGLSSPCFWYTNLKARTRQFIPLTKSYNPTDYPKYDNYNAIEVSKTPTIPKDYDGLMGVPPSYIEKHNHEQFEIVGLSGLKESEPEGYYLGGKRTASIKGKQVYRRIFIKRRK